MHLSEAIKYASEGYYVFPLQPGKSTPLPGSMGFKDATRDVKQIQAWWQANPKYNIGIRTGEVSDLTVIDIDGKAGFESANGIIDQLPKGSRVVTTPHGKHLYYKYNSEFTTGTGFLPGIDVRNDGAYVVAPPSVVNCTKKVCAPLNAAHNYVQGSEMVTKAVAFSTAFNPARKRVAQEGPREATTEDRDPDWFGQALQGVKLGQRDDMAVKLVGRLHRDKHSYSAIVTILQGYADRCDPPWRPEEDDGGMSLEQKIEYWMRQYPRPQAPVPKQQVDLLQTKPVVRKNAASLQEAAGTYVFEYLDFLGQPGFIVRGCSHLIAAYPKVGKTELVAQLCHSWRDEKISWFTEEPEVVWSARLGQHPPGWRHMDLFFTIRNPDAVLSEILTGDATVVVIDTIRSMLALEDENANSEIDKRMMQFIDAARETGKTLIFLHHNRKGGGDQGEAIAGGHAFMASVDIALDLRRDRTVENRRVVRGWGRIIPIPELVYEMDPTGKMVALGDPVEVTLKAVTASVAALLTTEWTGVKDIHEALAEPRPSVDQIRLALKILVGDGSVQRDPTEEIPGKRYLWRVNPALSIPSNAAITNGGRVPWSDEEVMVFKEEADASN